VTLVEYVSHAEPGGDVPAFVAERPQRTMALDLVRRLLAHAAQRRGG
jgi:hypothetical protein